MICPHCKRNFSNRTNICPRCGRNLSEYKRKSAEHAALTRRREAMRVRQTAAAAKSAPAGAAKKAPHNAGGSASMEFGYPFRGMGIFFLIICFLLAAGAKAFGGFTTRPGTLLEILAQAFTFVYFLDIINSSATGSSTPPDLPSIADFNDILVGFVSFAVIDALAAGPAYLFGLFTKKFAIDPSVATAGVFFLRLIGIFYFPMACIYVSQNRTYSALNPLPVIKSVLSAPSSYYTICFCMFIVFVPGILVSLLSNFVPLGRESFLQYLLILFELLKIYVFFLLGRALGLFLAD